MIWHIKYLSYCCDTFQSSAAASRLPASRTTFVHCERYSVSRYSTSPPGNDSPVLSTPWRCPAKLYRVFLVFLGTVQSTICLQTGSWHVGALWCIYTYLLIIWPKTEASSILWTPQVSHKWFAFAWSFLPAGWILHRFR